MRQSAYLGAVVVAALTGCSDNLAIFNVGVNAPQQRPYQQPAPAPQSRGGLDGVVLLPTEQLSLQDRQREDLLVDEETGTTYRRRVTFVPSEGGALQVTYRFGERDTPDEQAVLIARDFYAQVTLAHANGRLQDLSGYTLLRVMQNVDTNHDRSISRLEVDDIDPDYIMPQRARINGLVRGTGQGSQNSQRRPVFRNRTQ